MIKNKFGTYYKLIVLAVIISPYTLLRFSFFGLAELIFFLAFFYEIEKRAKNGFGVDYLFTKFWRSYLIVSLLGYAYNVIVLSSATGTFDGMTFDLSSYLLVGVSCYVIENLIYKRQINTYQFLKHVFFISSILMGILFAISLKQRSLFGFSLKYHNYFVPLAVNLHQISMYLVPFPFFGIKILKQSKNNFLKLFILMLIVLDVKMAMDTGSTKALLSILTGSVVYVGASVLFMGGGKYKYLVLIGAFILLIPILLQVNEIILALRTFFSDNDGEGARSLLYSESLGVIGTSPIVGHGTGQHLWDMYKFWDAHQTFITVALQAGMIGVFLLCRLFYRIGRRLIYNPAILAAYSAIVMYALGGDIMRRLPTWIFLVFFCYYNVNDEKNIVKKKWNSKT